MDVNLAPAAARVAPTRFTSFRFTLAPTAEQDLCYRRHAGAARVAYNQVVELHIEAKRAKRVGGSGAERVWVPVTPLQCIDVFNKWKKVPAVRGVATGEGQGKVTLCGPCSAEAEGLRGTERPEPRPERWRSRRAC